MHQQWSKQFRSNRSEKYTNT